MTKTQTESFTFARLGTAYNGSPLWEVSTPGGVVLGMVAKSNGKRGATWIARYILPGHRETNVSCGGFRNREVAAQFLARQES